LPYSPPSRRDEGKAAALLSGIFDMSAFFGATQISRAPHCDSVSFC